MAERLRAHCCNVLGMFSVGSTFDFVLPKGCRGGGRPRCTATPQPPPKGLERGVADKILYVCRNHRITSPVGPGPVYSSSEYRESSSRAMIVDRVEYIITIVGCG